MNAPEHLQHKPIVAVNDYDKIDGPHAHHTDTRALSIGQAQYDGNHISGKVWRHTGNKWSRQSEEMPIHRSIDLATLFVASLLASNGVKAPLSNLNEQVVDGNKLKAIHDYYLKHETIIKPKLEELKRVLDKLL
ncbi:DUF6530 family protein [Pontibacter mangrovi]|uniref:Uncharacterized protein n=1 Tax=Pontibacter mangrovi TaxID=2589816 RepID=A0A501W975_9BACT|nr:DUF6530 family protein [Pontibacter mangrovi]TPE43347.1 hypothetical protein FJM65_14650 [Pontibacter mangrovi]